MSSKFALVVAYTGDWPVWSPLFFSSVGHNPIVDLLLICEKPPPFALPGNVVVRQMTIGQLTERLRSATGLNLERVSGHKICDFKPFFGLAFGDFLEGYAFWGFCDIDLMFGDLAKLLTPEFAKQIDIFSASNKHIVGHFTLIRNDPELNAIGFQMDNWRSDCLSSSSRMVDEIGFTAVLRKAERIRWSTPEPITAELRNSFCRFGITFGFQGEVADVESVLPPLVEVRDGRVIYSDGNSTTEVLYIHFMGLKRWWHWLLYRPDDRQVHRFSRIGYGGPSTPGKLARFPWKQVWIMQSVLQQSKSKMGGLLRALLPETSFLRIRRWVFGKSRY